MLIRFTRRKEIEQKNPQPTELKAAHGLPESIQDMMTSHFEKDTVCKLNFSPSVSVFVLNSMTYLQLDSKFRDGPEIYQAWKFSFSNTIEDINLRLSVKPDPLIK